MTKAAALGGGTASRAVATSLTRPAFAYRADIDGLRALAVIPVLLFHAGFPAFSGGFVGVDIFFVISGYLITSIIHGDIEANRFSLLSFYERRIRRIFPALFTVLLASTVMATLILLPDPLKDFGQSVAAATLFASNVLFWEETGYFAGAAEQKPLLHTWSLAVEEQFYLVFPLFLLLLARAGRGGIPATAAILLLSFAASVWAVPHAPTAAFYLAPFRAWELLLGALLAMGALAAPRRQIVRDALSLAGLALILVSVLAYSADTPFPGASAVLPCLGTALLIHAGSGGPSLVGRLLSQRPIVLTGLVSYSLYLWHWPLLVFASLYALRELTAAESLGVLLLAALLATLSWRYVELPFRGPRPVLARPTLLATAGGVMLAAVVTGMGLHLTDGLPSRLPPDAARLAEGARDRDPTRGRCLDPGVDAVRNGNLCRIGAVRRASPSFIVWGDSHAESIQAAIGAVAAQTDRTGMFAGSAGCPPLLGIEVEGREAESTRQCAAFNDAVLDLVRQGSIDTVIMAAHWAWYATGERHGRKDERRVHLSESETGTGSTGSNEAVFRRALERTATTLRTAGKKVVIVAPIPEVGASVPTTLALAAWLGRDVDVRPTREDFDQRNAIPLSAMTSLEQRSLATILYPHEALCDAQACRVDADGRAVYADDNHLSLFGAASIRSIFEAAF
jgi:peptidoglycan/LPS O-acetylase OafA/YrhL